ncbi:MAG: cupin [Burkholderiales bacterium]|nr:cupin [Burkholderiales bacterium]
MPAGDLDATLAFFTDILGFRVAAIFPADAPAVAVVAGHGLRLRLDGAAAGDPGTLRLACTAPETVAGGARRLTAPNGTVVDIVDADPPLEVPPLAPRLVVTRRAADAAWHRGRAGMTYRDLIPDRLGGRFIASHIRIEDGGPVPDYVHFHKIRFQMIYVARGWVRVVYEDQGAPFVMHAGDCVLQPPRIRHRVLESSPGLEVVEIACPAWHETFADPALDLPNARLRPQRDFSGQRFVRHVAAGARWQAAGAFAWRDIGFAAATGGLAAARVVRLRGAPPPRRAARHDAEFDFLFVLAGALTLECAGAHRLEAGDCCVVPGGTDYAIDACTPDLQLLEVLLPAAAGAPA